MKEFKPNIMVPAVKFVQADETWMTSIENVQITGMGSLRFTLTRPDSGDALGGWISLYKDHIGTETPPIIHDYAEGRASGEHHIESDKVDFTKHKYVLCYGPHYTAPVETIVTSVDIIFGQPLATKASVCVAIAHEINSVTSYYEFDNNPLGFGNWSGWVIVREGGQFGEGRAVGSATVDPNDPSGIKVVPAELSHGKTYNVTSTIYSQVRPVAGYTFTTAG